MQYILYSLSSSLQRLLCALLNRLIFRSCSSDGAYFHNAAEICYYASKCICCAVWKHASKFSQAREHT